MSSTENKLFWFLMGVATVFILKYDVIGLKQWNIEFHPEIANTEIDRGAYTDTI